MTAFIQYIFSKLIYLHLSTEIFHKDFSLLIFTHQSKPSTNQFILNVNVTYCLTLMIMAATPVMNKITAMPAPTAAHLYDSETIHSHYSMTHRGYKVSTLIHTCPHKHLRKTEVSICNHQADCPFSLWSDI